MPTSSPEVAAENLALVLRAGKQATEAALGVVATLILNEIKVAVTQTFPPSSAPDTPPHLRTGGLRLSYRSSDVVTDAEGRKEVTVYSDRTVLQPVPPGRPTIYAGFVEFGTRHMASRPHFRPAVASVTLLIPGIVGAAWSTGVRSGNAAVKST